MHEERITVIAQDIMELVNYDVDKLFEMAVHDAGTQRIESWLRAEGLAGKCRIGVVGVRNNSGTRIDALAKVVVPGKVLFTHQELYSEFPSDHFKTKLLLVTGGTDNA